MSDGNRNDSYLDNRNNLDAGNLDYSNGRLSIGGYSSEGYHSSEMSGDRYIPRLIVVLFYFEPLSLVSRGFLPSSNTLFAYNHTVFTIVLIVLMLQLYFRISIWGV